MRLKKEYGDDRERIMLELEKLSAERIREAQKKDRQLRALQRKANKFGMELVLAT